MLVAKLKAYEDKAQVAADLLQLVIDQVQNSVADAKEKCVSQPDGTPNTNCHGTQHARQWPSCELRMLLLLTHIMCRKNLKTVGTSVKLQAVASVCFQSKIMR